jgi:cyclophilin family peptidyl-prolyl cis-trans isomerase
MMKYWRFLPLTLAALGCVSCASIKNTVNKINPFDKNDASAEVTADVEPEKVATPIPANANDAVMIVNVGGNKEEVVIHLRPDLAPKHVANFKKLVSQSYYDDLAVHRAIRGYLIQTGDPLTKDDGNKVNWGTGGPEYKIASEVGGKHKRGAIAAARLNDKLNPDKGSSGSQFYIMLRTAKSLDADYTVFAEVTRGIEIVDKIAAQTVDTNDMPVKRVEIKSIRLVSPGAKELDAPKKSSRKTVPESQKGFFTKMLERFW